jgi:hypothetical protein
VTEMRRKNGRKVSSWFLWRVKTLRRTDEGGFTLVELMTVTKRSVRELSKIPLRLAMCDRVSVPLPLRVYSPEWEGAVSEVRGRATTHHR